jgi:DNA-directed RNA polymerase specialized sigma24 family protein
MVPTIRSMSRRTGATMVVPLGVTAGALAPPRGVVVTHRDHATANAFLEGLFERHHNEIYAYLLRMLRDPDLAADLTQDAFIKAYRAQDTLEKPENARAWLYQIAHRVALDELRRRKIERALDRIPERQRAALILAEVHDLTGLELAAALGISHVAARALLTRGRESLRQALADEKHRTSEREAAIDAASEHTGVRR